MPRPSSYDSYPLYKKLIEPLKEKARELGYALTVHGSLKRDIDLVAIPWTQKAVSPKELAEALRQVASSLNEGVAALDPLEADNSWFQDGCQPYGKPHGRYCWSFHLGGGPYIDLSVMPRLEGSAGLLQETALNDWCPFKAYLVGYVVATGDLEGKDRRGNPTTLVLTTPPTAEMLIQNIAKALRVSFKIEKTHIEDPHPAFRKPVLKSICTVPSLISHLSLVGITPYKSKTAYPLPQVPTTLFHHFARGIFDGEGGVDRKPDVWFGGDPNHIPPFRDRLCQMTDLSKPELVFYTTPFGGLNQGFAFSRPEEWRKIQAFLYQERSIFCEKKRALIDNLLTRH